MPNGDRTRHRRYLEEKNVGAADVSLCAADMPTLDAALAPGRISGQRYGPKQAAMVDRRGSSRGVARHRPHPYLVQRMIRGADLRLGTGAVLMAAMLSVACSPKRYAISKLGDALANPGTTYAADDDPELIAAAAPFSLKVIESLLESSPRHEGLLLAAASGFTQYSYAFVQQQADFAEDSNLTRAAALRLRARKLDLRARDYGLRGLDVRHAGFTARLRSDPRAAVRPATKRDVALLYWTAAAWGAAISVSKDVPDLVADQPIVEALIDRALELDETFGAGAIHGFLITYEMARQGVAGDPAVRSRQHFDRAVAISKGQLASPYVSYAEAVSRSQQNRAEFERMLKDALAIDVNAKPEWRLENLVMQERARWLMSKVSDLFLGSARDSTTHSHSTSGLLQPQSAQRAQRVPGFSVPSVVQRGIHPVN